MKKRIISVINITIDILCPQYVNNHGERYLKAYKQMHTTEWTKKRIEFFLEWTARSIRNQSFKDFQVLMLCSEESRSLIESYSWDKNITHCYDYGQAACESLDADYISMTNLDSDDLIHRDAMKIIRENLILSDKIERVLTSDYYRWLFHHNCFIYVTNPLKGRVGWSPCWTLIFPRSKWTWKNIKREWFVYNPQICRVPEAKILSPYLVCQIRTTESTHHAMLKQDPAHAARLKKELKEAKILGQSSTLNKGDHTRILADFGISEDQYNHAGVQL